MPEHTAPADHVAAFAPKGVLRASINLDNPILANIEPARAFLARFVEDMKASGVVAAAMRRHRIVGATVAPAA